MKLQNNLNNINPEKIMISPSTLEICSCMSCSVCTQQDNLRDDVSLTRSCGTRKRFIINNFIHSLKSTNKGFI